MEEAATVPLRKKAVAFLIYAVLNFIIGLIIVVVIGINFDSYLPKGQESVIALTIGSMLLAVPVTLWIRHRYIHADERAERRKADLLKRSTPPSRAEEAIGGVAKGAFVGGAIALGLYLAFLAVSALPISVAIVLGAVIIGLCILASRTV